MSLKTQYEFLVFLLLAVLVLEYVGRRLRLPPAAAFITGGMVLALVPGLPRIEFDPELVLVVFLPPLLMSGAYFTLWRDFRSQLKGILSLAVGAVIFTTLCVGLVLHQLLPGLPLAVCFAIGAVVSPPDAVAATAVLRKLNLPPKLLSLLEGESLINDASGLVLFGIAVTAATTGHFNLAQAGGWFLWLAVAGVLTGVASGTLGMFVIRRLRQAELVITMTLLLSSASYILAETIGASGVLSTVATGLIVSWHQHDAVFASTRVRAHSFWQSLVFLMESLLFVLIGLSLRDVVSRLGDDGGMIGSNVIPAVAVVVTVVIARFVWIALCSFTVWQDLLTKRGGRWKRALPQMTMIGWAGMRGVVTLAAALSFPADLPGRDLILTSSFAVIIATVFLQGTTLAPLAKILGVASADAGETVTETKRAVRRHVRQAGPVIGGTRPLEAEAGIDKASTQTTAIEALTERRHFERSLESIRAARSELVRVYRNGAIDDRVLRAIEYELDLEEMAAENRLS